MVDTRLAMMMNTMRCLALAVLFSIGAVDASAAQSRVARSPGDPDPVAATEAWDARHVFTAIHFRRVSLAVHGTYAYVSADNGPAGAGAFLRRRNGLWSVQAGVKGAFAPYIFEGSGVSATDAAAVVREGCPPLKLAPGETFTADQRRLATKSTKAVAGPRTVTAIDGQLPRRYRVPAVAYRVCRI